MRIYGNRSSNDSNMKGLKKNLKGKLTSKEMKFLVTSFDIIGDIAIIQIPDELKKKEKIIGKGVLELQKNVKVALKPKGMHKGVYRVQKMKVIAGEKRKTTEYKESGVRMKLNVEKTYFSPRFGTERLRIAKMVKAGEEVSVSVRVANFSFSINIFSRSLISETSVPIKTRPSSFFSFFKRDAANRNGTNSPSLLIKSISKL